MTITTREDEQLIAAVHRSAYEEVATALANGANPNACDATSTLSALMIAAGMGALQSVRLLLAAGSYVNLLDSRAGAGALHKACQGGHIDIVKALVDAGAFVDLQTTTTGHTPLVEAIWFASDAIVEYLLDENHNARLEPKTYYGFTLDDHINYALRVTKGANRTGLLRIQDLVAKRRAADSKKAAGALNTAVLDKDLPRVQAAIARDADLEERYPILGSFSDGHTPLLIACRDGCDDIVAELIRAGANVNAIDPIFGAVPLHKATYHGYLNITQMLAGAKGIRLDYQGPSNGYAPLHDALWHGYADCAEALLTKGARTDIVAYDGKLPIDIAIEQFGKAHPIVATLQKRM